MEEAERIALEEHGSGKIAVISGDWRGVHDSHLTPQWGSLSPLCGYCVQNWSGLTGEGLMLKPSGNFWAFGSAWASRRTLLSSTRPVTCAHSLLVWPLSGHCGQLLSWALCQLLCLWKWSLVVWPKEMWTVQTWDVAAGWLKAACSSCPFQDAAVAFASEWQCFHLEVGGREKFSSALLGSQARSNN